MTSTSIRDHFRDAVEKLIPDFAKSNDKLGLAVSGGPDSLALLLLAHDCYPKQIDAATVDHGLRPEAKEEAEMVADICVKKNIPHNILKPSIPIRGSIQSEARKVRYSLLHGWMERENIMWLATAHHADDQLETLVMRLLRGSGIDGMSAIRAKRGYVIRPLLHLSKKELEEYLLSENITAVDDPSNHDQSFDRVRVRKALSQLDGFNVGLASQSAAALDDARKAIGWMVENLSAENIERDGDQCTLKANDFPHEILRRLVLKCLHICDPALSPRGPQLERIIVAMQQGETVTIGDTMCKGGKNWSFEPAPARRN
jgi:tRNA(Ile)-lysidine synthase